LCANKTQRFYVGLTGGFGAGKSTVSKQLHESYAVPIIDVDRAGRKAVDEHPQVQAALRRTFGEAYFNDHTQLKRKKMAELIFRDEGARHALNRIVHPVMLQRVVDEIYALERAPIAAPYVVVDAALLFELALQQYTDVIVTVWAPFLDCVQRAARGQGLTESQVSARYLSQWPVVEKLSRSDFVVNNSGTLNDLMFAVEELHRLLVIRAESKSR